MIDFQTSVDADQLKRWVGTLPGRLQRACDIRGKLLALQVGIAAPVDTTALEKSAYYQSATGQNSYNKALEAMAGADPRAFNRALEAVPVPERPGCTVAMAARHAAPINNGFTHNRTGGHIGAQPFFTREVERARADWSMTVGAAVRDQDIVGAMLGAAEQFPDD